MLVNQMRRLLDLMESRSEQPVNEAGAGPGRILQHIRNGVPFFTISAMRSAVPHRVNLKRAATLRRDLDSYPVVYLSIEGEYQEAGSDAPSIEHSLFVMPLPGEHEMAADDLRLIAERLRRRYEQDSVAFGDGQRILLLFSDGTEHDLGGVLTFSLAAIANAGGHSVIKGRKFSFTDVKNAPKGTPYGSARDVAAKTG